MLVVTIIIFIKRIRPTRRMDDILHLYPIEAEHQKSGWQQLMGVTCTKSPMQAKISDSHSGAGLKSREAVNVDLTVTIHQAHTDAASGYGIYGVNTRCSFAVLST